MTTFRDCTCFVVRGRVSEESRARCPHHGATKALPPPDQDIAKGFTPAEDGAEAVEWLRQRVRHLENQLSWRNTEYAKLNEIYTKLADQWNAFQATLKPIQRDVHRAEEAGEFARKLAERIIRLAYNTGSWADLLEVLNQIVKEDAVGDAAKQRFPGLPGKR